MNIAIFCEYYYPFISGVVTHIELLKNGLESRGHNVMIVTLDPKTHTHYMKDGVLYCPAIPLKRIYGYGVGNPLNLQRLKIIREFAPDIIHIHTEFTMGIFARFAARKLKVPLVYTLHTMYDDYLAYVAPKQMTNMMKPAAHHFIRYTANYATEIIGPSYKVVEYLRRCGITRHINIIPNIVNLSGFLRENVAKEDIARAKKELGIHKGDTALCYVGRLGNEKSLDVLVDWFAGAAKTNPHYKLYLIGDGPEKDRLQKQIDHYGLSAQIMLTGRIDHELLAPYYQACDLFATASLSEMNSISMLEANASGLYMLQRFDLYNKDQIQTGINGATFTTQDDFQALINAQASLTAAEKKARREKVESYSQRYTVNDFLDSVLNVYTRARAEYNK